MFRTFFHRRDAKNAETTQRKTKLGHYGAVTASCFLPTAYRLLLTAYCLPPSAYWHGDRLSDSHNLLHRTFTARGRRNSIILALTALFLFILLAVDVRNEGAITVLDARINIWLHSHGTRGWLTFFLWVSSLYSNLTITLVMAAILAYLWSRHLRRW